MTTICGTILAIVAILAAVRIVGEFINGAWIRR
jgi:hypothetical protein